MKIKTQKDKKPIVAFICVHNSCRSQIAEALGNSLASDVFYSYSAGTKIKQQINQDAVRLMKKIYNIDMEKLGQKNKLISEIPSPDIVILMGCEVSCPIVDAKYIEDWGIDDPSGKSDEQFIKIINQIKCKIEDLCNKMI